MTLNPLSIQYQGQFKKPDEHNSMKIPALIVGTLLLLYGLSAQVAEQDSLKKEVISVLIRQQDSWNRGDLAGYMDGYWKSDSLLFTSAGNIRRGWNVTYEKYKASYGTHEKMGNLKFSDIEITLLGPNAASIFGHWELTRPGDHPDGVFTLILRRFKNGWKIIHDHTSSSSQSSKK
jgi:ketosteroid isomerase-like protein